MTIIISASFNNSTEFAFYVLHILSSLVPIYRPSHLYNNASDTPHSEENWGLMDLRLL